jgi:uncharacterized membrane protein
MRRECECNSKLTPRRTSGEAQIIIGDRPLTLEPLLNANPIIQLHAFTATGAFVLGAVQLAAPKGTLPHRVVGLIWVLLMVVVSGSAFFIHELRIWGLWSPIHLIVTFTLAMLSIAVWRAHKHAVEQHRRSMLGLFFGSRHSRPFHVFTWSHHARGRLRGLKKKTTSVRASPGIELRFEIMRVLRFGARRQTIEATDDLQYTIDYALFQWGFHWVSPSRSPHLTTMVRCRFARGRQLVCRDLTRGWVVVQDLACLRDFAGIFDVEG